MILSYVNESSIAAANQLGGPQIRKIDDRIGYGLFADQNYVKDEFVTYYDGETYFTNKEGAEKARGDYVLVHKIGNTHKWIVINGEKVFHLSCKGRFINEPHSEATSPNLKAKYDDKKCMIYFVASRDIKKGEELLWFYGDQYDRNW